MTALEGGTPREIVATLPGGTSPEYLQACERAGMNRVRIHGEKTGPEMAAKLIRDCHLAGLKVSYDTNGKKPRVRRSEGMTQITEGLEKDNWVKVFHPGERMLLVDENREANPEEKLFVARLSCLPQVFTGNGEERLNFSDGEICCTVKQVTKEGQTTVGIEVEVDSVRPNIQGLFWKMGVISPTTDIFSGDDPALVAADIRKLEKVKEALGDDRPDQIAISFVCTKGQMEDAQAKLNNIWPGVPTLAKIETVRGVDNIDEIVQVTDVEVARGDLTEAVKANGKYTLPGAEARIIIAAKKAHREVIVATHVADSLLNQARRRPLETGERLVRNERVAVCLELPEVDAWMLAAETMVTGKNAQQVISATSQAIRVAERYWQMYGRPGN